MPKKFIPTAWNAGEYPSSELAQLIILAYLNDDFILPIIYGPPRIGKSVYALKVLFQVYDFLLGWDRFRVYEECIGYEPERVINAWGSFNQRMPGYIWDDAGCWLFTLDYHDPLLKEIQRYFNVLATDLNCLILTTPDPKWILTKIGKMPGSMWIKIIKTRGVQRHPETGRRILDTYVPSVRFARRAYTYQPWRAPDMKKEGVRTLVEDDFYCMMEEDIYQYYKPQREYYAGLVKGRMREEMHRAVQQKKLKDARVKKQLQDMDQHG